jgi:4,5-dihydroxyphthalate decarboxylase
MATEFPATGRVTLRTNLADHKVVAAMKQGDIASDLVTLDYCGPRVANEGFKPMIRAGLFDAGELAIVSYLQARAYRKRLVLLPAVVLGGALHQCLRYNPARHSLKPINLEGRTVGIRAYTQTTCVWIRGLLAHEYGVDLDRVTWGVMDDAHLAEFADPPSCRRLDPARKLEAMLESGEIDATVVSPQAPPDPKAATLIPNALEEAAAWSRRTGINPINHMFVVSQDLCEQRPDVVRDIYRMLVAGKQAAPANPALSFGVEPNRKALETIIAWSVEQKVIPRAMAVDDLFDDVTRALPEA